MLWEIRLWVLFQPGSCTAPINHSHLLPPATILKYWWPHSDHSSTDPHSGAWEDLMYMQHTFPSHKHGLAHLLKQISPLFYLMHHLPSPLHSVDIFFSPSKRHWRDWRSLSAPWWFVWFSLSAFFHLILSCFLSAVLFVLPAPFSGFVYLLTHSEMLPLVYKWRKICLLLEWWQASKQTAGILPTMPTMMDNTRESSQMQLCLCVKWFHLLAHCLVMSLSVLHGYFQNGILQSMHYYILPTLFFFNSNWNSSIIFQLLFYEQQWCVWVIRK